MDIDAIDRHVRQLLEFKARAEPMLLAYEAHVAAQADADEASAVEGDGTADGVEAQSESIAASLAGEGMIETLPLVTEPEEPVSDVVEEQAPEPVVEDTIKGGLEAPVAAETIDPPDEAPVEADEPPPIV